MSDLHTKTLSAAWVDIKEKLTVRNVLVYMSGMVVIGIGVGPMIRSNVGVSSWDTFNFSLSNIGPNGIPFGVASGITATFIMLLTIFLYRNWVYLLMTVPIVFVSIMILFFDEIVYASLTFDQPWQHIAGFVFGILLLPLGGSLMISTTLPAGVYDEFMLAVLNAVKSSNIALVRAIIELIVVLLAWVVGSLVGIGTGRIGIGTLIFSVLVGVLITIYLAIMERIGMYDRKQMN